MKKQIAKLLLLVLGFMPIVLFAQQPKISNLRAYDKSGINQFESSKSDTVPFSGLKVKWGAGFTQQFQNLKHENPGAGANTGVNRLYPLSNGFMTAQANLFMDAQLADGIRLNVTSYLSARHHNETWVKGGYIQFDKLPFKGKLWSDVMKITTIKVGHMEINYGDQHFRRSDGGNTIYNPFMDNYIMDEFATEIGGEVYVQKNGLLGMVGMTSGMIKGSIDSAIATTQDPNTKRNPSIYFKLGFDKKLNDDVRVRLTGSYYTNTSNAGSGLTLFGGDRTGSNYQNVMEKGAPGALPASTAVAFSGRFNPGFSKKIEATMLNGFVKVHGFEVFATYETSKGRSKSEVSDRKANQYAIEGVYRFGKDENLFVGARYNEVSARLVAVGPQIQGSDVKINRTSLSAGWFLTKNVLLKGEIVDQKYVDFPSADYRSTGKFSGYVIEAVVGF
jgi:urease beta subunit